VKSRGDIIITIDDDLEASPSDIGSLIERQKETKAELVYAQFTNASPGFFRNLFTGIYKFFTRKIQGEKNGKGSSFRLITRQLANQLSNHFHEFVFIDELCLWYTRKVEFVNLKKYPSARKKSNYSIFELSLMTGDLVLFSTVFPLRMVTVIGGSLATINFIIGFYFIIKKFFLRVDVEGYTSLIVSILFSTGLILFALGIIAEYLSKTLKSQYKKPGYSVYREI
jgi:undecaprenyl-phosphate 4-deoxy-4-formamido-L-arabinose transferase